MPFREKLKKAFKSSSPSSSKHSSPTISQGEQRWPSNVYRPDEPMPRPKYRAPVKKEHKEKLEAFNFGSSWRRRSHVSLYSPMGSRLPSRRNSRVSRKSVSGPSGVGRDSMDARRKSVVSPTRNGSIGGQERRYRHSLRIAQQMKLQPEPEQSGDDDVANVGISRVNSHEKPPQIHVNQPTPARTPAADDGDHNNINPSRLSHLSNASSDGYFPTQDQHIRPGQEYPSSTASKADSGPAGQHIISNLGLGGEGISMFTEEDLAKAMARSRMSSQAMPV